MTVPAVVTLTNGTSAWANQVATDVNNLLASVSALSTIAGVPRYATTAARDAAIPIPAQGNLVYVIAGDDYWYYTGAAWANFMDHPDLISRYAPLAGGVILTDAAQTFTTSVAADVTWGTEVSDPDGWTAGGIALLTVPAGKAGRYLVTYNGKWSAIPGSSTVACYINGVAEYEFTTSGGIVFAPNLTFMRTLAVGDTIRFTAFQSNGVNRDLVSRLEIAPV